MTATIAESHATATIASPDDGLPRLEHPRKPKVKAASIDEKLVQADEAGRRAAAAALEEAQARHDALVLSTKIAALESRRTELWSHLDGVEKRDLKLQLEQCREIFRRLFMKPNLSPAEMNSLNEAGNALGWIPAAILEVAVIKKDLKAQIATVETDIAVISTETK